jgi:hypothetical protein
MAHVFISYVRDDEPLVASLCNDLREKGVIVWLDRDRIAPGTRWRSAIRSAIVNGAYFLACFSERYTSRERTYMNEELTIAIEQLRQRPVARAWFVPLVFGADAVPEREIGAGETLRDIQWIDLGRAPHTTTWRLGINRLREILLIPPLPSSPEALSSEIRKPVITRSEESLRAILRGTARETINAALDEFIANPDQHRYDYLLRPVCEVFGNQFDADQVVRLVTRGGQGNSRTGFHGLCVLYDWHFDHMCRLKLAEVFSKNFQIGFFVKLREKYPGKELFRLVLDGKPEDFQIDGACLDSEYFLDKFMNRGESAFLDAVFTKEST